MKIYRVLLILFSIGVSILSVELYLRIILKDRPIIQQWTADSQYRLDDDLIYGYRPSTVNSWKSNEFSETAIINSDGFRGDEIKTKKSNVFRIIAVGDSFTFGHGIESNDKTYPARLEQFLNNNSANKAKNFEVINVGVKGYSPDQEYKLITKRLIKYQPDLIIWNFSNPGDIFNTVHNSVWPVPALYNVKNNSLVELNPKLNWLYISNFIRYHTPTFINKSYIFNSLVNIIAGNSYFSRKPNLKDEEMIKWATEKMFLEVTEANKFLDKNKIKLIVVILPYKEIFSDSYNQSAISLAFDDFIRKVQERGIETIDVKREIDNYEIKDTDAKRSETGVLGTMNFDPKMLYYSQDYHPNNLGAKIFSEIVGQKIFQSVNRNL
jgi:hypothetical protein